jgi:uncharacterized protein
MKHQLKSLAVRAVPLMNKAPFTSDQNFHRQPGRSLRWGALCAVLALCTGCAGSPPVHLYRLSAELPAGAAVVQPLANAPRWAFISVTLPDYLDRDAILVPTGQAGLNSLPGQRWAEPLRDAVTRVMRADLTRLRGADRLWSLPLPQGVTAQAYLKVELLSFEAAPDRSVVHLAARWWLTDPSGARPTQVHQARFDTAVQGADVDALAAAHRAALWTLAQDIAKDGASPSTPAL